MLIFCEEVTRAGTQVLNGLGGVCLDGGVHCSYTSGPVRVRDLVLIALVIFLTSKTEHYWGLASIH